MENSFVKSVVKSVVIDLLKESYNFAGLDVYSPYSTDRFPYFDDDIVVTPSEIDRVNKQQDPNFVKPEDISSEQFKLGMDYELKNNPGKSINKIGEIVINNIKEDSSYYKK